MKRKLLCTILIATILSFTGCSSSNSASQNEVSPPANNSVENEKETSEEPQETEEPTPADENITIEETIVFEQDGIKITANSFDNSNSLFGPEIKFLIENDSERNITVQARNVSINGYMVDSSMSADVMPQKKNNDSLTFMESSLEQCGIEKIAEIEFSFHIFDSDSWDDIINSDMITLKTSCAETYVQNYDDSGEVIYDGGDFRIISKGLSEDTSLFGPSVILYIENNMDEGITIQARDTSINGYMIEPTLSPEIAPHKRIVTTMTFFESDMEENQIEKIEAIETSFHVFYTDGWDNIIDTEPLTINFTP